jgi:poly-gamma-glutamate synthesis protein (capsule biosynthesis protein)
MFWTFVPERSQISGSSGILLYFCAKLFPMKVHPEKIWSGFRAETSSPAAVAMNGWRYLLKYLFKKRLYISEEREWGKRCAENLEKSFQVRSESPLLSIGLAGDLMWLPDEKQFDLSPTLIDRMKKADCWIGNLESPLARNKPVRSLLPDQIRFASSPLLLSKFRHEGKNLFGMLSLANNHILDAGTRGMELTRNFLNAENISYSGLGNAHAIRQVNGLRIGFFAATYGVNFYRQGETDVVSVIDNPSLFSEKTARILQDMEKQSCDLKIISLHWGHEYEFFPSPGQRLMARKLAEAGADIILGHHPHVVQPVEILFSLGYEKNIPGEIDPSCLISGDKPRKTLVAYSLGNFMTSMITPECRRGLALILSVFHTPNGADWEITDQFLTDNRNNLLTVV